MAKYNLIEISLYYHSDLIISIRYKDQWQPSTYLEIQQCIMLIICHSSMLKTTIRIKSFRR